MATADGSVEIRITGSVDPSVAASATEAKTAMAGLGDAATVSAKDMAAALAATGGNLKKITPDMVGLGTAAKSAAVGQEALSAAAAGATATTAAETAATEANTAATINNRAAYEATVLVHEAIMGRWSRMTASSMILAQQLGAQSAITKALTFATSVEGAAILGTIAVVGAAVAATITYDNAQKHLQETVAGLGAASQLSAQQLNEVGQAASKWADQSVAETTRAAAAFDAAGVRSQSDIEKLAGSVQAYAQVTGVKFADAQKTLAEAMQDPVKGAQELHDQLGLLNGDQLEQIQRLTEVGDKDQAVAILAEALKERTDDLHRASVGLTSDFGGMVDALSNVWTWLGNVNEKISESLPLFGQMRVQANEAFAAQAQVIQNQARLNEISGKGAAVFNETPEGTAVTQRNELIGKLNAANDALKVDMVTHGAHSEAVEHDREAVADYTHAVSTYKTEVQKKTAADQLDVKIAEARHQHNAQLVKDLTEQKALLSEAGKVESDADAKALAAGAGDVAGASAGGARGARSAAAGADVVAQWEQQLHQQEVLSQNYFADQTSAELAFWQSKLELTRAGSKDWLDVQSKIYDAQKTLAHQAYDEHLADLNDRLEADRDDWKKEQADWADKLAFIKSKNGEESAEYKDAHRQMEAEERQHQDQMLRAELSGNSKEIEALKQHLAVMRQERETDATAAEAIIKDEANGQITGEATAAARIGQIHLQLANQEIADAAAVYNQQEALRQKGLADAVAAGKQGTDAYKQALQADLDAQKAFQDQVAEMQAKAAAQQIQDILAVKQAYTNYVSGTVDATVQGLDGMISRTESWKQAVIGVYQSIVQTFEASLSKMATNWIVTHVFMTAAQRAQLAIQNAQHAASEAVKTASTTAGVTTRLGVENTGFFAKLLSLLGISVGTHAGAETAKTAATVTGATTRATTETTTSTASAAEQTATNVALVTSYSGVAGAAGTASWAAAPWPIDAGAPTFGASMAAAALAFAPQAALATGTNEMPRDMIVQMHEGERVIPKADNVQLMNLLSVAARGGSAASANAGDVHFHSSPTFNGNIASWQDMVDKHERDMIRWLNLKMKNGALARKAA